MALTIHRHRCPEAAVVFIGHLISKSLPMGWWSEMVSFLSSFQSVTIRNIICKDKWKGKQCIAYIPGQGQMLLLYEGQLETAKVNFFVFSRVLSLIFRSACLSYIQFLAQLFLDPTVLILSTLSLTFLLIQLHYNRIEGLNLPDIFGNTTQFTILRSGNWGDLPLNSQFDRFFLFCNNTLRIIL